MLAYFAEDPIDKWIPALFQCGGQEAKECFALAVESHCETWMKQDNENGGNVGSSLIGRIAYKVCRADLKADEVKHMLGWCRT